MGTRADFYVGRGETAEWLGSIAWDGYPDGIDRAVLGADTAEAFKAALTAMFAERTDVTLPTDGWPWPWDDSGTTDYAYAFDGDAVYVTYGYEWWFAAGPEPEDKRGGTRAVFPNMAHRKNVQLTGAKSGLITIIARDDGSMDVE